MLHAAFERKSHAMKQFDEAKALRPPAVAAYQAVVAECLAALAEMPQYADQRKNRDTALRTQLLGLAAAAEKEAETEIQRKKAKVLNVAREARDARRVFGVRRDGTAGAGPSLRQMFRNSGGELPPAVALMFDTLQKGKDARSGRLFLLEQGIMRVSASEEQKLKLIAILDDMAGTPGSEADAERKVALAQVSSLIALARSSNALADVSSWMNPVRRARLG